MTDLQPLWDWFRWLYETHGIKLTIFYDAFDRARFFNGFLTSLRLMALCIVASVVIGDRRRLDSGLAVARSCER